MTSVEYQGAWVQVRLQGVTVDDFTVLLPEDRFDAHPVAVGDHVMARWSVEDTDLLRDN